MSDENKFTIEEKSDASETAEGKIPETEERQDSHYDPKKDSQERRKQPPRICYMCRRSENRAGRLIEIPGGICVCADCMQKSFDSMQNGAIDYSEIMRNLPPGMGMFDLSNLNFFDGMFGGNSQDDRSRNQKKKHAGHASGADADGSFRAGADVDPDADGQNVRPMTIQDVMPPHKIKEALDEYVIGQEQAKKIMSVGVYNHYKRILSEPKDGVEIAKSNMLMIGPTGSGKTYLVQTLARLLNVPLAMTDATSLTEAGYIGDDIESVVSKLLMAADNDVERAEHGIIFIDEIDKIAKKKNVSQRDVSGEAVQQGLLKLLEGSDVEVPVGATNKNAMVPLETVNTSNILFICGGAFPDLELIIKQRLNKTASIGFQADLHDKYDNDPNLLQKVTLEDLRKFGMIPEFLGRMPVVFALHSLTEDMLVEVLKEPRNAILKQYERLLELDEVKLSFEDAALHAIAKKAMERDTGARALRAVIEEFMLDIMYEIPKDKNIGEVVITKEYIEHTGGPRIVLRSASVPRITGA